MADATIVQAIRDHLTAHWSSCPIAWENEAFDKPLDGAGNMSPWVLMEISGTYYGQESIGASRQADNRWDEEGVLWLHVFVATGTGSATARGYARSLADLFRGTLLLSDSLEFLDASIGAGEKGDANGATWRVSITIDWRRMAA